MLKVSVLIITYNHEKFIATAIESVLNQRTSFEIEIVVGEDCSTDGTRKILEEFQEKFPDKIKLLLHDKNVGMHRNFEMVLTKCAGEYIAVLEGDDYWTDSLKLQRQVEFMEANPDCTECFHKVTVIYQDKSQQSHDFPVGVTKAKFNLEDVVSSFFIPTLSIMFKRSAIAKLPAVFYRITNPDWMIHVLCSEKGKVGFIDEVMGVYRVHSGGVWSGISRVKVLKNTIKSAHVINAYLNYQFDNLLKRRIAGWHREAGQICCRDCSVLHAIQHYLIFIYLRLCLLVKLILHKVIQYGNIRSISE